jgi:membrane-associated phospholipid phosphatase
MPPISSVAKVVKQPPFWLLAAGSLAFAGGADGRRAAVRGSACYLATAGVANLVLKPLVHRRRPQGAGPGPFRPRTSSMPSGHAASDTAFAVGAWLELPGVRVHMLALTTASHWSAPRATTSATSWPATRWGPPSPESRLRPLSYRCGSAADTKR